MGDAFTSIASLRLPTTSRVLRSSWCPDKDLLVIVTRPGGRDKLSLWKMQGSKKWEVDFDRDILGIETVIDIAWSPDGMVIAVAHDPPAVTLHSIQDGRQLGHLPIHAPTQLPGKLQLTGITWFQAEKKDTNASMPDIFMRGHDITGSAHSILKGQPLLDPLHDETQSSVATEVFAFQSSRPQSAGAHSQPSYILSWPSLPTDLIAASMKPPKGRKQQHRPGEELDEVDETNVDSILGVSDNQGNLHCFLDGSYSLGSISTETKCSLMPLHRINQESYFAHTQTNDSGRIFTSLQPALIRVPLLKQRIVRDVARVSSSTRELVWYAIRLVKEMRVAWFGSETQTGARAQGPKWVRALEVRQRDQFGQLEPNAILDLTALLVTGRVTDALGDYLGSSEHMSERGIQKWESSVVDALTKIRDYSEKRLTPACQRIHIMLEEVQGWSLLPQYSLCGIQTEDVNTCLELAGRGIVLASWLAATARRELIRFREFITWLRSEATKATTPTETQSQLPPSRHDPLDVNDYLMSGLVVSSIDKWFMGPVPQFSLEDLGVPPIRDLASSLKASREALAKPKDNFVWPPNVKHQDHTRLDRNLDGLIQDLAMRCYKIFKEASRAASRSAVTLERKQHPGSSIQELSLEARRPADAPLFIRERSVINTSEDDSVLQYLAIQTPHGSEGSHLFMVKLHPSGQDPQKRIPAAVAVLENTILGGEDAMESTIPIEVLNAEFFDGESIIVVYRRRNQVGPTFIGMVGYADLEYQNMETFTEVNCVYREELVGEIEKGLGNGQLASVPIPINQFRAVGGCKEGGVMLCVNGRVGRRVACVLDDVGLSLEILDMEGEGDEEEDEEEMDEDDVTEG